MARTTTSSSPLPSLLYFVATSDNAQGLFLVLLSGITPGGTQGTTWDSGKGSWMHAKQIFSLLGYLSSLKDPFQCHSLVAVEGLCKSSVCFSRTALIESLHKDGDTISSLSGESPSHAIRVRFEKQRLTSH